MLTRLKIIWKQRISRRVDKWTSRQVNINLLTCLLVYLSTCLLFLSCSKDKVVYDIGEYKVDLATVQTNSNNQSFLLDNNTLLLNKGFINNLEAGQRVLLNYSYLEDLSPGYDYVIKVNGISAVTQGQLSEVSPITIDTITNVPIHLESVWLGSHYLNVSFYMNFYSKKHTIALITGKTQIQEKNISIYFCHNDNNDSPGVTRCVITSFDLSNVLGEPVGDRQLTVNLNSGNYGEKDYSFIY